MYDTVKHMHFLYAYTQSLVLSALSAHISHRIIFLYENPYLHLLLCLVVSGIMEWRILFEKKTCQVGLYHFHHYNSADLSNTAKTNFLQVVYTKKTSYHHHTSILHLIKQTFMKYKIAYKCQTILWHYLLYYWQQSERAKKNQRVKVDKTGRMKKQLKKTNRPTELVPINVQRRFAAGAIDTHIFIYILTQSPYKGVHCAHTVFSGEYGMEYKMYVKMKSTSITRRACSKKQRNERGTCVLCMCIIYE